MTEKTEYIVFGDLHISPETEQLVIPVLEKITADILLRKPRYVVCTGDVGDFKSTSRFTKNKGDFSTQNELNSVFEVLTKYFYKPLADYNRRKRKLKKKLYRPFIIFCIGNHDKDVADQLEDFYFKHKTVSVPYRQAMCADGVSFSHAFEKGVSGTVHTSCAGILKDLHMSCVCGHQHVREVAEDRDISGNRLIALRCPCATLARPAWAGVGAAKWDTGWLRLSKDRWNNYHYEFMEF